MKNVFFLDKKNRVHRIPSLDYYVRSTNDIVTYIYPCKTECERKESLPAISKVDIFPEIDIFNI